MTNNMVKKLLNFSCSNVRVETYGEPEASEGSRKGLLKVLALAALFALGATSMPEQASADSFLQKEETDISFSAYQKDAVQLERERALRAYEAEKAEKAEKAQRDHEVAQWKHEVAKWEREQELREREQELRKREQELREQPVVIVQPHANNRDWHLGYRSQPRYNDFKVTRLKIDRNGRVEAFAFTGNPTRAMCASVANTRLSEVDSIVRREQRKQGMNGQELKDFDAHLKGLIIVCNGADQKPAATWHRSIQFNF